MKLTATVLLTLACIGSHSFAAAGDKGHLTSWGTADSLMPAWGVYPLSQSYGDTKPLDRWAAWCAAGNEGRLTWVAEFPRDGDYQVWVRQYGGYGDVKVLVDERPVADGAGGPGGGRYVWRHVGHSIVNKGQHHIDLAVSRGMLDAVLFTTDRDLQPWEFSYPSARATYWPRNLGDVRGGRWRVGGRGGEAGELPRIPRRRNTVSAT